MSNINRVQLLGNLGASPELTHLDNGTPVAKMSIATNEEWTDKAGNKQQHVEWHRVTCWGKLAENCAKYLVKGRQVLVEGKIRTRRWEKDGKNVYATDIVATQIHFLGSGGSDSSLRPDPPLSDADYYGSERS
jgi:single-strand DNA-binding protein